MTEDDFAWDGSYKKISDLIEQQDWDIDLQKEIITLELVEHILNHIKPLRECDEQNTPYCMLDTKGAFSAKSA